MTNQEIFISGSTGVIGSSIVEILLSKTDARIHLLIRAESSEHLKIRFHEMLVFWKLEASSPRTERLIPHRGDATAENFGLEKTEFHDLSYTITHIIHCASSVKLNMSLSDARQACFIPAERMIAFAKACKQNGRLQKIEYISTVGINGRIPGILLEEPLYSERQFHNTYENAKAEAETFILENIAVGFPITIHRPSMVIGNSQTGKIVHFQVFYHLAQFLTGKFTGGFIPQLKHHKLDIIPSDIVAKGIVASLLDTGSVHKIYNWCSGPDISLPIEELRTIIYPAFKKVEPQLPRPKLISYEQFLFILKVLIWISDSKNKRKLQTLYAFLAYAGESQGFDNHHARELLAKDQLCVPAVRDYLPQILEYYLTETRSSGSQKG